MLRDGTMMFRRLTRANISTSIAGTELTIDHTETYLYFHD